MVSLLPYYSFKDIKSRKSVSFAVLLIIALLIAVVSQDPSTILFLMFLFYSFSGFLIYLLKFRKNGHVGVFEE